jgi:hypothetical protein
MHEHGVSGNSCIRLSYCTGKELHAEEEGDSLAHVLRIWNDSSSVLRPQTCILNDVLDKFP